MSRVLSIKKHRLLTHFFRNISSEILACELNNDVRKEIEKYWSRRLIPRNGSQKFFATSVLRPSVKIHSEDLRLLTISDSIFRYHRMNNHQVNHTVYWQLHQIFSKNHCQSFSQLQKLIPDTKQQLEQFHLVVGDREIPSDSLDCHHRSQYLFLKLYHAGLIYERKALINNGHNLEAKLKNEISNPDKTEKSSSVSKLWFLKTSKFAQDFHNYLCSKKGLLADELVNWHKNRIGECNGFSFDCSTDISETLNIWVENPLLVPKAQFIAVKPKSLFDVFCEGVKDSNGKLEFECLNPFTLEKLPIYVTEDVEYPPGRDTHLGIPTASENDRRFAENVGLKIRVASEESYTSDDINSLAMKLGLELNPVNSKLADWPISRTERRGIPVPVVHCYVCGIQPVLLSELPIVLPYLPENLSDEDTGMFLKTSGWSHTVCPKCGGKAERERMSIDPIYHSCMSGFEHDKTNQFVPVDLLTNGGNDAPQQLHFTRFLSYILYSLGLLPSAQLQKKFLFCTSLLNQSTFEIMEGKSSEEVDDEATDAADENISISLRGPNEMLRDSVNFSDIRNKFGCDASRLFMLFSSRNQRFQLDQNVQAEMLTWQNNLWLTLREFAKIRKRPLAFVSPWIDMAEENKKLKHTRNECIRLATLGYRETHDLTSCIAALRKLTNILRTYTREARKLSVEYERSLSALIIMLTPIMPHFAATLWLAFTCAEGRLAANDEEIVWNETVMAQKWPKIDNDHEISVILRVNSEHIVTGGPVLCNEIKTLTLNTALEIVKKSRDARKFLKRNHILDVYLETVENLHAELIIRAESKTETEKSNPIENSANGR